MPDDGMPLKRRVARALRRTVRTLAARFQPRTTLEPPDETPDHVEGVLTGGGVPVTRWTIPAAGYAPFLERAGYPAWFLGGPEGDDPVFGQRTLEHYVALALTDPKPGEVLIDVGSNASPFIDVAERVAGATAYELDLQFPAGIHGRRIGGGADAMPVPEAFADVLVIASAFIEFEGDADTGFVREAARVLRPGGRAVILPFYCSDVYGAKADPMVRWNGRPLPPDMRRFLVPGIGMRFSRLYDPAHLRSRVLEPAVAAGLEPTLYRVIGGHGIVPHSYVDYALMLRRPAASR